MKVKSLVIAVNVQKASVFLTRLTHYPEMSGVNHEWLSGLVTEVSRVSFYSRLVNAVSVP
jgi:hypothetical protein